MTDYASTCSVPRKDVSWFQKFTAHLAQAQTIAAFGGSVDILLLGDSITEACSWMLEYQKHVSGLKILDFGIGGDQTRRALADRKRDPRRLHLRFATLLIGVNNLLADTSADELRAPSPAAGRCAQSRETRLPTSRTAAGSGSRMNHKVDTIEPSTEDAPSVYGAT
jgi:hypothetical protein